MNKILIPSIFASILFLVSCDKKNDSHEGHDHEAGEHYKGDGHDHDHDDTQAHSQEEFTVGNDTVKTNTGQTPTHTDGESHKH